MHQFSNINTVFHYGSVTRECREKLNGHKSFAIWFTGLPASGKSTIAHGIEERLHHSGHRTFVLDGDNVRHGLCCDLGFSPEDRSENIRRIGEVIKLFIESGTIVISAFISPFKEDRKKVRGLLEKGEFIEIYCRCPIEICELRDSKKHYARARVGDIRHYTGISAPYEEPEDPELIIDTDRLSVENSVDKIMNFLYEKQKGLRRV